ncbi:MAG: sarcosine oxidase subunit gamma [Alkalilacustris sp.]
MAEPLAEIAALAPMGMIVLRGDAQEVGPVVKAVVGLEVPGQRQILRDGARAAAWMSPDEWLLMLPRDGLAGALEAGRAAAGDAFVTLADVSDARVGFTLRGARADEVVMKLCPVDIPRLPEGEIRRTRAGQIAAALWRSGPGEITLVCFRSVAGYARGLLENAARPGSAVFRDPGQG